MKIHTHTITTLPHDASIPVKTTKNYYYYQKKKHKQYKSSRHIIIKKLETQIFLAAIFKTKIGHIAFYTT